MLVFRLHTLILCCALFLTSLASATPAREMKADFWNRFALPHAPQRIVSLSPATTEMLFALQADAKVVAVTQDCNYPAAATRKPKIGRFGNILLEKIVKARPDLIVATADMQSRLEPLKALSIPVLALETRHVNDIFDNTLLLGQLTGQSARSESLIKQWRASLPEATTKHPRAFYMVWNDPLMTASPSSFIGDLMQRAGARNVVSKTQAPFLRYRQESLLKANPELLIVPRSLAKQVKFDSGVLRQLSAVKNQRILVLEDDLISRPGPRSFEALQQIHQYVKAHF